MKPAFAAILAAATALALATGPTALPVRAAEFVVHPRTVDDRKAVFGTVESVHQTEARARIGGTLESVAVVEGDKVNAGQTIAVVRDPKLVLRMAEIAAQIKSLEAQRAQARIELDRATRLRSTGAASQAQYDSARTNLDVVAGQLAAADASRRLVVEQEAEGNVLAPVSGRVLKLERIAGTVVMPGESVATIAAQTYVLRIYLPERHARFIKEGDTVQVGARGLASGPGELREGRIRLVYPELDHGRVVADVDVAGLGDFFVGERTKVYVATGKRTTFVVPRDYVLRRFGVTYVRLKSGAEVPVQTGEATADGIEVLSGLRDGDVLVGP